MCSYFRRREEEPAGLSPDHPGVKATLSSGRTKTWSLRCLVSVPCEGWFALVLCCSAMKGGMIALMAPEQSPGCAQCLFGSTAVSTSTQAYSAHRHQCAESPGFHTAMNPAGFKEGQCPGWGREGCESNAEEHCWSVTSGEIYWWSLEAMLTSNEQSRSLPVSVLSSVALSSVGLIWMTNWLFRFFVN